MSEIKLKRGQKVVSFKKEPNHFAVRLRQGKANNETALQAACGTLEKAVKHVDSAISENIEIFAVLKSGDLETVTDQLRTASASDVVTHMYTIDDTKDGEVIPTGTMTIAFQPQVSADKREKILGEFGLEVLEALDDVQESYTVRLTKVSKVNPLKIAAELQRRQEILTAEPDLSFRITYTVQPSDNLYIDQWHLKNRGTQVGMSQGADVDAEGAWNHTIGSREITVCVMDDGFDLGHPDFNIPGKIVAPRDFGQEDFDPTPVYRSDNHGTACAGVAIAEMNGIGTVGLAPGCSFMPVRTSGWLSDQAIKDLFQYAIDNKADVISCSWKASSESFPLSTKMFNIIKKAATEGRTNKKGCVILFAAGNEDAPLDGVKDGVTYHQGFGLHPNVITVGASNSLDERSYYSNYGPELTLCAPSSGSPGWGIVTTDRSGVKGYSSSDYTHDFGGTSSATPLAAGLAALILSVNPELTSTEAKQIMIKTAKKIDQEGGKYQDGHSPYYGYGRIDAHRAILYTLGMLEEKQPEVLFMEHRVNKPIKDLKKTTDAIQFPLPVKCKEIEVHIDIHHTYKGDLRVTLISPKGQKILLHNKTGGSIDNLIKTWRSSDSPELFESVFGINSDGEWKLHVEDLVQEDEGILKKWSIAITYETAN